MAIVFIPALLRPLTGGRGSVEAAGATVGEIIVALEAAHPGLGARLTASRLAVAIDGEVGAFNPREPVGPASEIHFVAAIQGGRLDRD